MPIFLSPAAMQRLYHPDGDRASARAAEKFNTFFCNIAKELVKKLPITTFDRNGLDFFYRHKQVRMGPRFIRGAD